MLLLGRKGGSPVATTEVEVEEYSSVKVPGRSTGAGGSSPTSLSMLQGSPLSYKSTGRRHLTLVL